MSFGPITDGGNSRPAPYPPPVDGGCGGGVGQFSAPIPGPCGPCGPGGPGSPDGGNSGQICQSLDFSRAIFMDFCSFDTLFQNLFAPIEISFDIFLRIISTIHIHAIHSCLDVQIMYITSAKFSHFSTT